MALQQFPLPANRQRRLIKFVYLLLTVLLIGVGATSYIFRNMWFGDIKIEESLTSYQANVTVTPTPAPTPVTVTKSWPILLTHYQADSYTVVVNKKHQLASDYVPNDLTSISGGSLRTYAARALENLINEAESLGYNIKVLSAYRSYNEQLNLYNYYASIDGTELADTYSARPGHSEHQLGLAADVADINVGCQLLTCFGNTNAGKWIATNSANYGFIVRYPDGKTATTGYQYEPWHLRYVGINIAKAIYESGLTMDEYFGKTAGDYQ